MSSKSDVSPTESSISVKKLAKLDKFQVVYNQKLMKLFEKVFFRRKIFARVTNQAIQMPITIDQMSKGLSKIPQEVCFFSDLTYT